MQFQDLAIGQRFRFSGNDNGSTHSTGSGRAGSSPDVWMKVLIPEKYPDSGLCGPEEDDIPKDIRAIHLSNGKFEYVRGDTLVILHTKEQPETPTRIVPAALSDKPEDVLVNISFRLEAVERICAKLEQNVGIRSVAQPNSEIFPLASLLRLTMEQNIFLPEDWTQYYSVNFSNIAIPNFPWSGSLLNSPCPFNPDKRIKDTHFAFLGLPDINGVPLTVAQWIKLHPQTGQPKFYHHTNPWHQGQPYTDKITLQPRWYLLLKEIVPSSTDRTPEEQVVLLPPEYEIPSTIAEVTKDLFVFKKTGIRSNPSQWAACAERTIQTSSSPAGNVSCVGGFGEGGLNVNYWADSRHFSVGLGASRKPA